MVAVLVLPPLIFRTASGHRDGVCGWEDGEPSLPALDVQVDYQRVPTLGELNEPIRGDGRPRGEGRGGREKEDVDGGGRWWTADHAFDVARYCFHHQVWWLFY